MVALVGHLQLVGDAVDLEPTLGVDLGAGDLFAHSVGEDLGATSGHRHQPGLLELLQHLAVALSGAGDLGEVMDLSGRPGLDLYSGVAFVEAGDQVQVVLPFALRVMSGGDVDLGQVRVVVLIDKVPDLVEIVVPDPLLTEFSLEAAEGAADVADVGLRQAQAMDEVGLVADLALAHDIGQPRQGGHVGAAVEGHPLIEVEPLALQHLVGDGLELRIANQQVA